MTRNDNYPDGFDERLLDEDTPLDEEEEEFDADDDSGDRDDEDED